MKTTQHGGAWVGNFFIICLVLTLMSYGCSKKDSPIQPDVNNPVHTVHATLVEKSYIPNHFVPYENGEKKKVERGMKDIEAYGQPVFDEYRLVFRTSEGELITFDGPRNKNNLKVPFMLLRIGQKVILKWKDDYEAEGSLNATNKGPYFMGRRYMEAY